VGTGKFRSSSDFAEARKVLRKFRGETSRSRGNGELAEFSLDQAVFARVVGHNRDPTTHRNAIKSNGQRPGKRLKLLVDRHP
jgi:hypothetical protein